MSNNIRDNKSWSNLHRDRYPAVKNQNLNQPSQYSNLNKSNISVHSDYLWNTLQEVQLFPAELAQLLRNEDRNVNEFKMRIQHEKNRVGLQIDSFKRELIHHLDDFKLSSLTQLDNVYKMYMERYTKFKTQIHQIKRMRDDIEIQLITKTKQSNIRSNKLATSNFKTVKSLEEGLKDMRKYHIINYITELQKNKIIPLVQEAKILILLTQYENGYHLPNEMSRLLTNIKQQVKKALRSMYENKSYMRNIQELVAKSQTQQNILGQQIINNHSQLKVQHDQVNPQRRRQKDLDRQIQREKEAISKRQRQIRQRQRREDQIRQRQFRQREIKQRQMRQREARQRQARQRQARQRQVRERQMRQRQRQFKQLQKRQLQLQQRQSRLKDRLIPSKISQRFKSQSPSSFRQVTKPLSNQSYQSRPIIDTVSKTQQTCVYEWLQQPSVRQMYNFRTNSNEIILCALILKNQYIAIGGKDGTITIYTLRQGEKITTLIGHKSSICSLAIIDLEYGSYLASGSDHGCSTILMWDLSNWSLRHKLQGHSAAVTAIVDMRDGQNILSGSYDKKINVYDLKQGKLAYNLPANKSSVTGIVLNSSSTKMVSCGLDNSLNVWQIIRSSPKNTVETIFLQRIIQNNTMICSIVSSMLLQQIIYIGTKDGKIKIINIQKGQSHKNIICCNNAVIQMVVLERQSRPGEPIIIAWPCKEQNMKIINTENQKINNIPIKGYIQFGCGIGPKGLMIKRGELAMLSQSQDWKEINLYKIEDLR